MARKIEVEIVGDSRSLERAFARSERAATKFEQKVDRSNRSIARGLAGAAGGVGITAFLTDSTQAASNLAEQISKTDAVFRSNATEVKKWSKTAADSMGLAEDQALAAASSFGALFAPLGIVGKQAADQSRQLTELGADLASFYNTDVQSAIDAIRSGLVGEAEPLRRYGALLSETKVQQRALSDTGKEYAKQLTDQEKVLARLGIIYDETALAQGNFADTAEGAANQSRIFHAELRDVQASIGEGLLPGLVLLTQGFGAVADSIEFANRKLRDFHLGFATKGIAQQGGLFDLLNLPHFTPPGGSKGLVGKVGGGGSFDASGLPISDIPGGTVGRGTAGQTAREIARLAEDAATKSNRWFDARIARMLGRASDPVSIREQVGRLRTISGLLGQRLAATKDVTRRLLLEDQIADVTIRIRDRQMQSAADAKAAAEAAKRARQDRLAALVASIDTGELGVEGGKLTIGQVNRAMAARAGARMEKRLGWIDFAIERAEATEKPAKLRAALRKKEDALEALIQHEGLTLNRLTELWRVRDRIDDLNKQKAGTVPVAFTAPNLHQLTAGLGLQGQQLEQLRANLAGAQLVKQASGGYRSQAMVIDNRIRVDVDGRQVAHATRRHAVKAQQREPSQTRGRQTR